MAWDLSFKRMLRRFLSSFNVEVNIGVELAVSNQQIDFLISNINSPPFPFHRCLDFVIGEFKSNRDTVRTGNFYDMIGKFFTYIATTHGYGKGSRSIQRRSHLQGTCVMILGGDLKIPRRASQEFSLKLVEPGIYEGNMRGCPHLIVMMIETLARYEGLEWMGLFGSDSTIERSIEHAILTDDTFIKSIGYFLYKNKVLVMAEKMKKAIDPISLSIRDAVMTLGIKRVVAEVGLRAVIDEVGLGAVIAEVGIGAVIDEVGLGAVIAEVGIGAVIAEVGIGAVIDEVGLGAVIAEVGIDAVINEIGIEAVIDKIGIEAVIDKIGVEAVIDKIGVEAVIDKIGVEAVMDKIGVERIVRAMETKDLRKSLSIASPAIKKRLLSLLVPHLSDDELDDILDE